MVGKIVSELNPYDNLYYEVCNEPYWEKVPIEWEHRIANLVVEEERRLPLQHLISRNVANGSQEVKEPLGAFSIFNFHYPRPEPECVPVNYHLNKVIGCNETGFDGPEDAPYRIQAWQFMLAGGGLFNHLDVSFHAGDEAGSRLLPGTDNFGGGPGLRGQIRTLKNFIEGFDFVRMAPANTIIEDCDGAAAAYALVEEGRQYGIYIRCQEGKTCRSIALRVPNGEYAVQFVDVCAGVTGQTQSVAAIDGKLTLRLPAFDNDIAIRIVAPRQR